MAICSSIFVWKILWTEEPGRLQSMGSQRDMTEQLSMRASTHTFKIHLEYCKSNSAQHNSHQVLRKKKNLVLLRYTNTFFKEDYPVNLSLELKMFIG